jgi:hypothetical protein
MVIWAKKKLNKSLDLIKNPSDDCAHGRRKKALNNFRSPVNLIILSLVTSKTHTQIFQMIGNCSFNVFLSQSFYGIETLEMKVKKCVFAMKQTLLQIQKSLRQLSPLRALKSIHIF